MNAGRGGARPRAHHGRRGSSRRGAWALTAALALCVAPTLRIGAACGEPEDRLQLLGEEFVARRLARPPQVASGEGAHSGTPLAPRVMAPALAAERAWLRGFRDRLAALPPDAAPERASERALLDAAVERELLELEILRPFQRDPGAYLALVAGSVEAALDQSGGSVCARLQRGARRLVEVPEVLRAARLNLIDPPRALTELAIERCASVLRFYREDVPRLAAGCRSARLQADLAQADTIAVRAIEVFMRYLEEDLLPASGGEPAIGADACRRLLRGALGEDVAPIEALLAEARRTVEARRADLEALAPLVAPGGGRAALDSLASERPGDGDAPSRIQDAAGRVEGFLRGRDIVSLPPRAPPNGRGAPPFRADLGRLDRWEIDFAVANEGLPGRWLRALALRGASSRLSRTLQETWSGEDWGQYCERMMIDQGYGGDDPRYRLAGAARALRQAGRALAALAIHSRALPPDEVRRMLEERCLFDPARAAQETRWAAAEPARMGYTLGAQRLRELQEEARQRLGARFRLRGFHDAVLRSGASPPGIVRDRLWRELTDAAGVPPPGAGP